MASQQPVSIGAIAIVHDRHEKLPPQWTAISKSVGNHDADLNAGAKVPLFGGSKLYLCVRALVPQDTHVITHVTVVSEGREAVPLGHEVIRTSVTGTKTGNLNHGSGGHKLYLCVKKEPRYEASQSLTDLCIIRPRQRESCPPGYEQLDRNVNEKSHFSEPVYLGFKYTPTPRYTQQPPASSVAFGVPFGQQRQQQQQQQYPQQYQHGYQPSYQHQPQARPVRTDVVEHQAPNMSGDASRPSYATSAARVVNVSGVSGRGRTGAVGHTHPSNPASKGPTALLSGVQIKLSRRYQEIAALSSMAALRVDDSSSTIDVDQQYTYSFERELRIKAG